MSGKRKPVFLGIEERVVHGQLVEVAVYGEIDPEPSLDFDALLAELCGAGPEKLAAIKAQVDRYKAQLLAAEFPEFADLEFIANDEFLDTRAENAIIELENYIEEHRERFIALDKQLLELGLK